MLVPQGQGKFRAHLLRTDEDAAELCTALGIEPGQPWGFYEKSPVGKIAPGSVEEWATREAARYDSFPTGRVMRNSPGRPFATASLPS